MATKMGISWEEFLAAGKEGQRWEYVDGEVLFKSPVGAPHGRVTMKLDHQLVNYTDAPPEWVGYGTDTTFVLAGGNLRCPDAALVRRQRFASGYPPSGAIPFPPDIAFEVLSPNDTQVEVQSKRQDYYENDVIQVWLDPQRKTAEVISPNRPAQHLRAGQFLTLPELPDFRLDLSALFSV
jgi:Uma2 family endonuclease